jgi:hypothetical protein
MDREICSGKGHFAMVFFFSLNADGPMFWGQKEKRQG